MKFIKRLDEWGRLTLLESFMRRAEIQLSLRSMVQDLKILGAQLQVNPFHDFFSFHTDRLPKLITGTELQMSSAEKAHLDIQDSLEIRGIIRYIAGRPEELRALTETSSPSDCQDFAKALQMACKFPCRSYRSILIFLQHNRDPDISLDERSKIADALWKLVTWSNVPLPLADRESID